MMVPADIFKGNTVASNLLLHVLKLTGMLIRGKSFIHRLFTINSTDHKSFNPP